ncbi:hypothetical protein Tco_0564790 [Tanacetum coccineum]
MRTDWLSKYKEKIVCYEKIVQIPLSNKEILEVHEECPEGNLKQLKTMKVDVQKREDIHVVPMPVVKSPYHLAPTEMQELSNQLKEPQDKVQDAKTLFAAIQTRFGGNDATKKTQKTLLKQMYENFSAPSTESLDSIFNRLQKIVSQLAILGENISQEDLNLKFLRSLPSEWNTHVVVWRNKPDLDTMSFDDLYNNFKIVEQEVKGTASSSSSSMNVSALLSILASQPNRSHLVHEDLEQIYEDDLEEMDLKWSRNQNSSRWTINVEEISSKSMLAIDGAGFDWSFMADEEVPTDIAPMAFSDSEFNTSYLKKRLASVEEQPIFYKNNDVLFYEQLAVLKRDISYKDLEIVGNFKLLLTVLLYYSRFMIDTAAKD